MVKNRWTQGVILFEVAVQITGGCTSQISTTVVMFEDWDAAPPPPASERHDHLTKPAGLKWEKSPHRAQANCSHHARVSVRGQTGPAAAVTTPDAGNRWPVERPAPAKLNLIDRQTEPDTDTSLRLAAKIVEHNSTTADPVFHLLFPHTLCFQACISLSVHSTHIHTPTHWVISAQSQTSSYWHTHTHTCPLYDLWASTVLT